jgi:hypothetical protein
MTPIVVAPRRFTGYKYSFCPTSLPIRHFFTFSSRVSPSLFISSRWKRSEASSAHAPPRAVLHLRPLVLPHHRHLCQSPYRHWCPRRRCPHTGRPHQCVSTTGPPRGSWWWIFLPARRKMFSLTPHGMMSLLEDSSVTSAMGFLGRPVTVTSSFDEEEEV